MTSTIKALAGNADIDYNFADICGPTNFEEMDVLFNKYCKEASGGKNSENHFQKNLIKLNTVTGFSRKPTTIIKNKQQARVPSIDIENSINKGPQVPSRNSLVHLQKHESQMRSERAELSKHATMKFDPRGGSISFNQPPPENDYLQMAKDFNVPLQVYMGSTSPRERENRIIEFIKKSVSDEVREFTKKNTTKSSHKKLEKDLQKMKVKAETDKDDVFKWLHIRTFFEPLKKKLRARIIDAIRDDANQPIIDRMLEDLNKSKEQSTMTSENKINLENVAVVNNFDLLGNILEEGPSKYFRMSKSVKNLQKKTQQLSMITNSKPLSPNSHSPRTLSHSNTKNVPGLNIPSSKNAVTTESDQPCRGAPQENYSWSDRKERTFMSHRTDAKSRLFDKVSSSNWNDLGFSPMIQAYITDEKSKSERDVLLQRYLNGDLLSAEEYRFIASTSVSLNSCVDKKFLQKVVNYINPETINALELEIAESILKEYQQVRKQIKNARQSHLKEENQNLIDKVHKGDYKMRKNVEFAIKRHEQAQVKHRIVRFLDKHEEKKHWKKFENEPKLDASDSSIPLTRNVSMKVPPLEDDEEEQPKQKVQEVHPGQTKAFNFLRAFVKSPTYLKEKDLKMSKHAYHPSSKLISPSDPHQKDFMGVPTSFNDQKIKTVTHENPDDYKLHIHSPAVFKEKQNFRKYYSGGPADLDENIFQGNYQFGDVSHYRFTEAQRQVVPKIQAAWRGYRQRKAFFKLLEIARQKEKYYFDGYRFVRQDSSDLRIGPNAKQDFILMKQNTRGFNDNSLMRMQTNVEEESALTRKQSSMLLEVEKKSSSTRHDDQYQMKSHSVLNKSSFDQTSGQKSHRILSAKPKYFISDAKKTKPTLHFPR